jgi:hypothetical protein
MKTYRRFSPGEFSSGVSYHANQANLGASLFQTIQQVVIRLGL